MTLQSLNRPQGNAGPSLDIGADGEKDTDGPDGPVVCMGPTQITGRVCYFKPL